MVVGKIKISMKPTEIGESTRGAGFEIVHLLVIRADLIVSAERRAQEKWRWKQIVDLRPIRLALSARHSLNGQRLVYKGKLMNVIFRETPKVSEETSPLCR